MLCRSIILGRGYSTPTLFNGFIDDARIYNRALTPLEITYLANGYQWDPPVIFRGNRINYNAGTPVTKPNFRGLRINYATAVTSSNAYPKLQAINLQYAYPPPADYYPKLQAININYTSKAYYEAGLPAEGFQYTNIK